MLSLQQAFAMSVAIAYSIMITPFNYNGYLTLPPEAIRPESSSIERFAALNLMSRIAEKP